MAPAAESSPTTNHYTPVFIMAFWEGPVLEWHWALPQPVAPAGKGWNFVLDTLYIVTGLLQQPVLLLYPLLKAGSEIATYSETAL